MKPKLIIIHGRGTANFGTGEQVDSLFSKPNLSKHSDVTYIGDSKDGVSLAEIDTMLPKLIVPDNVPLNIIIAMHGGVEDGEYIVTADNATKASDLINTLISATEGRALNILFLSCFGANVQTHLALLPKGSKLISLSDIDKETHFHDSHNAMAPEISELIAENPFVLESLLEAYLFSQKFTYNTPMIGKHHMDGSLEIKGMKDLAKQYFAGSEANPPSEFLQNLCKIIHLAPQHLQLATTKILESHGDITDLICKEQLCPIVIHNSRAGTFEKFKADHEKQYYFAGALDELHVTPINFDEAARPDKAKLQDADLTLYAHLEYYVHKHNLLDNAERKELERLRESDAPDMARLNQLQQNPDMSIVGYFKFIQDYPKSMSILLFDDHNFTHRDFAVTSLPPPDYQLSINQSALPIYSVCMGLAFDQYMMH